MVEPDLTIHFDSESELSDFAAKVARRWRAAGCAPLLIGLEGSLGSGKTAWVRAMLRGLGYAGRVPSPTYTLLEHYAMPGLDVVHVDLYRLADASELENIGIRDWLAEPGTWMLVEWPGRSAPLRQRCDLVITLEPVAATARDVGLRARTATGIGALRQAREPDSNYST